MSDLVASWEIALSDGVHLVEFEHGTTTGKRVIKVDGKEIYRQDWMFKLVGKEYFQVGKAKCVITIDAVSGFSYEYTLDVNGKPLKKFQENQSKIMKAWVLQVGGQDKRVVLENVLLGETNFSTEKDTLDVWVNGTRVDTTGEFVDDGTETHFEIDKRSAFIKAVTTGKRRDGIVHHLFVGGVEVPEAKE